MHCGYFGPHKHTEGKFSNTFFQAFIFQLFLFATLNRYATIQFTLDILSCPHSGGIMQQNGSSSFDWKGLSFEMEQMTIMIFGEYAAKLSKTPFYL
jgi:hypothetical protein